MTGKVKWFAGNRHFGYIIGENDKEYFVHQTRIQMAGIRKVKKGWTVSFEPFIDEQGRLSAENVIPIKDKL